MRLMLDANVILDVLIDREPFVKDAALIWDLCETEKVYGSISSLTVTNLVYVMRKSLDRKGIKTVMNALSSIFTIEDLRAADVARAAEIQWDDFEDAVQYATAQRIKADYIITRNTKDFAASSIKAISPEEFIRAVKAENVPYS